MSNLLAELTALENHPVRLLRQRRLVKDIPTEHVCHEAQERLEALGRDDYDVLDELRLPTEKWRAWGVVQGAVFYFLWWDPDHTVCTGTPAGVRRR
jgi:hypothetical protein